MIKKIFLLFLSLTHLVYQHSYSGISIKNIDDEIIWAAASHAENIIDGPWKILPNQSLYWDSQFYPHETILIFRPKKQNFYGIWWEDERELEQEYTLSYTYEGIITIKRLL